MKKKRFVAILSVLSITMSLVLTGCGNKSEMVTEESNIVPPSTENQTVATPATEAPMVEGKVACILGVGGLGDQSYNDLAYAGMERAKAELGIDFDYAEPKQLSDFEPIMRDMAGSGEYGVIVCIGFDSIDPLVKIAPEFPEQKFAIIDGEVPGENIASFMFKEEEGGFLVGALAGLMQKNPEAYSLEGTNQLGFVGALEIPLIVKFNAGYQAGAKYVNPDIEILTDYVSGSNAFSDTTTAKEIALSQNNKGAEIVFHAAGGSGLGVFQAATEKGFYAIGCNSNQNAIDPDHIVASMIKKVDTAAFEIVKGAMVDNNLPVGKMEVLGVANNGCDYSVENSNVKLTEEDLATIESIKANIASGALIVPQVMEEVEGFIADNKFEG